MKSQKFESHETWCLCGILEHLLSPSSTIVTSACPGVPMITPSPAGDSTASKLSGPSTIVSFIIGIEAVPLVSPGIMVTVIGVLSKSDATRKTI